MTEMLPPVVLEILAKTNSLESGLARGATSVEQFKSKTSSSMDSVSKIGRNALLGVAGAVVGIGVESLKSAANFQESTTALVTGAGESEANLKMVGQGMLDMAGKVGISADQLSSGMYLVESAGFHGASGLQALQAAAEGARVGNADMKTVADGLTTTLVDYQLPASAAADITSKLVETVASGKTTMGDLAGSLHNVLPAASAAHIGLSQVLGAMATMTGEGISADQASQDLANTIRSLQNPTQGQAAAMNALGFKSGEVSAQLGKMGLLGTLNELASTVLSKMGPAGTMLLSTLKSSREEADKAKTEIGYLPQSIQKVAQAYLAGTVTSKDWKHEVGTLDVAQRQLAMQFAATVNRSRGFNEQLAKGGPAAKTFGAEMATLTGGATGMNVSLALTGGNMATFAANTKNIGIATKEAGGHVQGFGLTQKDLKTQFENAKAGLHSMMIELGDKLIPIVEVAIKWFTQHKGVVMALAAVVGGLMVIAIGKYVTGLVSAAVKSTVSFAKMIAGWVGLGTSSSAAATEQAASTATSQASTDALMASVEALTASIEAATAVIGTMVGELGGLDAGAATADASLGTLDASFAGLTVAEEEAGAASSTALGPIGIAIGVIVIAVMLLMKHWKAVWGEIKKIALDVWHFLDNYIIHPIERAFHWVVDMIKKHWDLVVDIILGPIGFVVTQIVKHWNGIVNFFSGIPGKISAIASGMWDGVKDAFKAAINWILRGWNALHFRVPKIHIPFVGSFGGFDLGLPQIPLLALGGRVVSPGLAVVGEQGPELVGLGAGASVVPLPPVGASSVRSSSGISGSAELGSIRVEVPLSIDGRLFARATATFTRDELLRLNRNLPNLGLS